MTVDIFLIRIICNELQVNEELIFSATRQFEYVLARQIYWFILRTEKQKTLMSLADVFEKKAHHTVLSGIEKIDNYLLTKAIIKGIDIPLSMMNIKNRYSNQVILYRENGLSLNRELLEI